MTTAEATALILLYRATTDEELRARARRLVPELGEWSNGSEPSRINAPEDYDAWRKAEFDRCSPPNMPGDNNAWKAADDLETVLLTGTDPIKPPLSVRAEYAGWGQIPNRIEVHVYSSMEHWVRDVPFFWRGFPIVWYWNVEKPVAAL